MRYLLIVAMLLVAGTGWAGDVNVKDCVGYKEVTIGDTVISGCTYDTWPKLWDRYFDMMKKKWQCYVGGTMDRNGVVTFEWVDCPPPVATYEYPYDNMAPAKCSGTKEYSDLLSAADGVLPYLNEAGQIINVYPVYKSQAQGLRDAADEIEARDAAIKRFRDALKKAKGR
jgi:hypothetical protein